jgi:hypothetical protein
MAFAQPDCPVFDEALNDLLQRLKNLNSLDDKMSGRLSLGNR